MESNAARSDQPLFRPQVLLTRQHSQLQAAGDSKLPVDIAEVALDSFFADGQFAGDFTVTAALFDGRNDLNFASCEAKAGRRRLAGARPRRHLFAPDPELPLAYRANTFQQQLRRRGFEDNAPRAKLQSAGDSEWLNRCGQQNGSHRN